jgi:hypothetical protein
MGRRQGRSKLGKRNARLVELLLSPLWIVLLFAIWTSGASVKVIALASCILAIYYLFFVPRSCGALRSNGKAFCEDDGRGFLRGCGRLSHLKWNLAKYLPGGWSPRRRAPAAARGNGSEGTDDSVDRSGNLRFPISELLAGFEAIIATLSLIATILAWQFPVG